MCHYACNSKVGTTTQSRQRNLDVSSWMHSRNKVCMCVCEQDTDSENSFNASMLLDLCTMQFLSVCLWAKTGWLRERLQPRRRCINSGVMEADSIHTHTHTISPPLQISPVKWGRSWGRSTQLLCHSIISAATAQYVLWVTCLYILALKKKKKSIYFPVHSLSDLHIFPSITGEYFKSKQATKRWFRQLPSHNSAGVNE